MKISGHKTRSVFDRYNITSEDDLRRAAHRLDEYIQQKKPHLRAHSMKSPMFLTHTCARNSLKLWRRGRDLNSRMGYPISGFQGQFDLKIGDSQPPNNTGD